MAEGGKPWKNAKTPKRRERVLRRGEEDAILPCAVCGRTAARIRVGEIFEKTALVYEGITKTTELRNLAPGEVFALLDRGDLAALHSLAKARNAMEDGLDAYCPDCDRIYCKTHYNVRVEMDGAFYDCSYGECPEGHKRVIDD